MFTTYKDVRRSDPEKFVNSPIKMFHVRNIFSNKLYENVSCQGRIFRDISRDKSIKFLHFFERILCGKINLKQMEEQKQLKGVQGHALLGHLHPRITILALYEQFSGKFCLNFLPLIQF